MLLVIYLCCLILKDIKPVCLPTEPRIDAAEYDNDLAQIIGWGSASLTEKTSTTLKRVAIQIYPQRQVTFILNLQNC